MKKNFNKYSLTTFILILVLNSLFLKICSKNTRTDNSADAAPAKYTIDYQENDAFMEANKEVSDSSEKCLSLKGIYYLVIENDKANMKIKASPIVMSLNRDFFTLSLLDNNNSFQLFELQMSFIKNITPLITAQKDLACVTINFEEITDTKLVKVYNIDLCHKNGKQLAKFKTTVDQFNNECIRRDPRLIENFSQINSLIQESPVFAGAKAPSIMDSVSYDNPVAPRSKKDIQKEILKSKVKNLKLKLNENNLTSQELCRHKKLKKMDLKMDEIAEAKAKILNRGSIYSMQDGDINNEESDEAIKTLDKIEKKVSGKIKANKQKSDSIQL